MPEFDRDTQVERIDDRRFGSIVDAGWSINGNPNGGYLLSIVSRAIAESVDHPDPLSFTTHYLRPGVPGVECEVIAAYGDLSVPVGIDSDITLDMPELPSPQPVIK